MKPLTVTAALAQWGPDTLGSAPVCSLSEARRYCRRLALGHYENFPVISWTIPPRWRQECYHIYAYCRWADDLADETGDVELSRRLLQWWRTELRRCFAGESAHPVFIALQDTLTRHKLPIEPFEDLLSAFEQDQSVTRYDTFDQLHDYCRRSANPVGRLVLLLAGAADSQRIAWSDAICTALQLANFWQDIQRDLVKGRCYVPQADLDRFGVTMNDLQAGATTPAIRELLRFQVDRATTILQTGSPLPASLNGRTGLLIDLFAGGAHAILQQIVRADYRVLEQRPVVTKTQVLGLLLKTLARRCKRGFGRTGR